MRHLVAFDGRAAVLPGGVLHIGVTGDNLVEEIAFRAPAYAGASAYLKIRSDALAAPGKEELTWNAADGVWICPATRALLALCPKFYAQLQLEAPVDGGDVIVWQSLQFPVFVGETIAADAPIAEAQAPYLQLLDIRVQAAADRAENASRSQPYVGGNGNWQVWDADVMAFVDSGIRATGPEGPQGSPGAAPVRGVDYWTSTDRQEIINDVDAEIKERGYLTEEADPTVPAWAKQPTKPAYTAAEVGALPDSYTETDPTVPAWAKQPAKPAYTAAEVGALPDTFTETDPTVPAWAKQPAKPTYTAAEVGALPDTFTETDPTVPAWAKQPAKPAYTAAEVGAPEKVTGAVAGNFAGLDAAGNLTDSGKSAADLPIAAYKKGAEIPSGADLNNYIAPGIYAVMAAAIAAGIANIPYTGSGGRLEVRITTAEGSTAAASYLFQEYTSHNLTAGGRYIRMLTGSGGWSAWYKVLAPAVGSDNWITPTLLNGWTEVSGVPVRYCKDAQGFIHFKGRVTNTASTAAGSVLMSLPAGYRPGSAIHQPISRLDSEINTARIYAGTDGTVNFQTSLPAGTAVDISALTLRSEA